MFIQTEATPNPNVLKFLPGRVLMAEGSRSFQTVEEADASPLARALFRLEGVSGVFFGHDFLTVARDPDSSLIWAQMKAPILAAIMDHFSQDQALMEAESEDAPGDTHVYEGDVAQIVKEIKELLDSRVRPAVAQDGGDILFDRFEADTGTLWLQMRGACSGCPSSSATLKSGVETMLRHYVPEVQRVEQV